MKKVKKEKTYKVMMTAKELELIEFALLGSRANCVRGEKQGLFEALNPVHKRFKDINRFYRIDENGKAIRKDIWKR